jgi:DNA polymerase III subunit epsilon
MLFAGGPTLHRPQTIHGKADPVLATLTYLLVWRMIAVHVLASGPIPWRNHLLAVGAVRFQDRRVTGRFKTLVRPPRRPGRYALSALEQTSSDFDDAPTFAQIEPALRDFLASDALVGFNIRVTAELLAAELSRINRPGLENELIELADLARQRGVTLHKAGLGELAVALGLNRVADGRADAAARLTAQVTARLLQMPVSAEPTGSSDLPRILPERWALLDPARVRGVAESPGVYVFRDQSGEVLYAGASGNLRRRLASYQSRPLELERRLEGLAERVWDIETYASHGYLEALLDEARIIGAHTPPFNVQRNVHMPRRFLRASTSVQPGLRMVEAVASDGATYLGPFESARAAGQALALAKAVYPRLGRREAASRTLTRRRPTVAERAADQTTRAQAVRDALVLLSGQREPALRMVRERASAAANEGNQLEAERLRRLCSAIVAFEISTSPLRDGPRSRFAVVLVDGDGLPRLAYHLAAGHILERRELADGGDLESMLERWGAERPRVELDYEAIPLVMRWLAMQGRRCTVTVFPPCEIS